MPRNVASVEIQAKTSGLRAQLREARAAFGNFASNVSGLMKRGMGKAYSAAFGEKSKGKGEGFLRGAGKHAIGNLMSSATEKAVGMATEIGKSTLDFEDKLARLQIQANETPEVMRAFADGITKASNATGLGRDKILDGATAFVTLTGDMKTAKASTATFAKVAQATGSDVEDIATTAAAASQNLGIMSGDFEALFSGLTAQGKMGAVELKDIASELSTIAPQWAQFGGGKGLRGARELGAALQIVKRGFGGDAAETVTGLNNFLTAVTKKSGRFRAAGVGSFFDVKKGADGKTVKSLKSVYEIVDIIGKSKLANDPELLTKALGSSEAYRAFLQLRDGRVDMEKFVEAAKDTNVIGRDFDTYMATPAARMAKAWENMKNAIAGAFTPERITAFANAVEELAGKVGTLADGLGKVFGFMESLNGVGKSIRGFFSSNANGNPWGGNPLEAAADDRTINGGGAWIVTPQGKYVERNSPEGRAQIMAAKLRKEHREGYNSTVSTILGSEKDEHTTKESIGKAALASYSSNIGTQLAGQRYLKNAGVTPEQVQQLVSDTFKGMGADFLKSVGIGDNDMTRKLLAELQKISANTGAGTKVEVDGNNVAKATKNASKHRGAVAH